MKPQIEEGKPVQPKWRKIGSEYHYSTEDKHTFVATLGRDPSLVYGHPVEKSFPAEHLLEIRADDVSTVIIPGHDMNEQRLLVTFYAKSRNALKSEAFPEDEEYDRLKAALPNFLKSLNAHLQKPA